MSKEQKEVGFRLALFLAALAVMILLAGFGFTPDESTTTAKDNTDISISTNE